MKHISLFCLMPIAKGCEEFYINYLLPTIEEIGNELNIKTDIIRADHEGGKGLSVMETILKNIKERDIMIIDITGLNPNVMWELGYCQAFEKDMIILSKDNYDTIPFNIRQSLIHKYKWENNIVTIFTKESPDLKSLIKKKILNSLYKKNYLGYDKLVLIDLDSIIKRIKNARRDSVISGPIRLKLSDLNQELKRSEEWKVLIHHESPIENLQVIFSHAIKSLTQNSIYSTISFREFWVDITKNGTDWSFFKDNEDAILDRGIEINRLIVIDENKFQNGSVADDEFLSKILRRHYFFSKNKTNKFKVKVIFRKDYSEVIRDYRNFALIEKDFEDVILIPTRYEDGRIQETELIKLIRNEANHPQFEAHETVISKYRERFIKLWDEDLRTEELDAKHFS